MIRVTDYIAYLYYSTDYGVNWGYRDNLRAGGAGPIVEGDTSSIQTSSDGSIVMITSGVFNGNQGYVYMSTNYGVTFTKIFNTLGIWNSIAMSANAGNLVLLNLYGGIYYSNAQTIVNYNTYLPILNNVAINQTSVTTGFALDVSGNIRYVAATATSDYRVKQDVQPLDETFTVDNLRPVSYYNTLSNNQDIGLIAHELQEHYPFLVHGNKDDDDYQSVNYTSLISVLINEIQQLKKRVSDLENK
jgi:hypothetical protein